MKSLVVPRAAPTLACSLTAVILSACAVAPEPRLADAGLQRLVSEDAQVRIDELRLRGQTLRLTVQPKGGNGRPYEILQPTPGADATQHRDAAGQRVWPVLTF